jgi:predicted type IV restriction endonuclease
VLNIEKANEADIREEIASPLLAALGYQRGTVNDILREFSLSYDRIFLGRKKKGDPPLRGRADYILSVGGAARWTLEVKAPSEEINRDAIEQAISYARHPEISGSYAAVLNGKRFVVFHNSQNSFDVPLVDIPVENVSSLAAKLAPLLSPMSIRRDCSLACTRF